MPQSGADPGEAMRLIVCLVLMLWPLAALADGLPPAAQKKIAADPSKFMENVQALILGYGQDGALTGAALADYIALERARARASAVRVLMAMDLDGDGALGRDELGFAAAASAASTRGRLWVLFGKADLDGDEVISPQEVAAQAEAAALRSFTEAEAQAVRALMAFDADGDGAVTVEEVAQAVAELDVPA